MEFRRLAIGFGSGLVAVVASSVPLFLGIAVGERLIPVPIMAAVAERLGTPVSDTLVIILIIAFHVVYGGIWGAILTALFDHIKMQHGTALGFILWMILLAVVYGLLRDRTSLGTASLIFAGAALFFHLVYGVVLGWLLEQSLS